MPCLAQGMNASESHHCSCLRWHEVVLDAKWALCFSMICCTHHARESFGMPDMSFS